MSAIAWVGAFVLGILGQALADEGAALFGGSDTWFLSAPLRLVASALSLWLWLLVGYPIWSLARRMPGTETPVRLLGLSLATIGLLIALRLVLDYLAPIRPIGVVRALFVPLDLFPLQLGLEFALGTTGRAIAALVLSGAALAVGAYLGRRG